MDIILHEGIEKMDAKDVIKYRTYRWAPQSLPEQGNQSQALHLSSPSHLFGVKEKNRK